MNGFEQLLSGMPEFRQIKAAVESRDTPVLATGLSEVRSEERRVGKECRL